MPMFRVRLGERLPHLGRIYEAGESVELPADLAADPFVAGRVEPVPAAVSPKAARMAVASDPPFVKEK